ncbi:MAG: ribonuclease PH [Mycobacteriaceae bacterium]|nr:ribonuclease PH [Mycobacteriaceae bacterium]
MSRRLDGRADDELREVRITRGFTDHPAGSVLVEFGQTKVLCTASITDGVPGWRRDSGLGWLTAEYAMLPAATHTRSGRESVKGKVGGRTQEISRLVGRSLRACIDLAAVGENTIAVDCDVLQADGGTRTAAITGAYVALVDAVTWLNAAGRLADPKPISCAIAAVSVGVVDGRVRLDLPYEEDSRAEVDMNVVATDTGTFVEIQGTGEGATFPRSTMDALMDSAVAGCEQLFELQRAALELPYPGSLPVPAEPPSRRKILGQ